MCASPPMPSSRIDSAYVPEKLKKTEPTTVCELMQLKVSHGSFSYISKDQKKCSLCDESVIFMLYCTEICQN